MQKVSTEAALTLLLEKEAEIERLRKALHHATICPIIRQVRGIMKDNVDGIRKVTACDGCRDALLALLEE
jgi:hypothetical protein